MSYFDDVVEPSLYRDPVKIKPRFKNKPTDARSVPWGTKDGQILAIGEMTDRHLNNVHNHIGKRLGSPEEQENDVFYYAYVRAEINRRSRGEA